MKHLWLVGISVLFIVSSCEASWEEVDDINKVKIGKLIEHVSNLLKVYDKKLTFSSNTKLEKRMGLEQAKKLLEDYDIPNKNEITFKKLKKVYQLCKQQEEERIQILEVIRIQQLMLGSITGEKLKNEDAEILKDMQKVIWTLCNTINIHKGNVKGLETKIEILNSLEQILDRH